MTRIRHNDYGVLRPPEPGTWRPSLKVSVVIPARDCQEALERTVPALARQTYPAELVEVIVADDGSEPPLHVPEARVVRVGDGWGRGAARQAGQLAATGDVIHWLDSDMILADDHIEAHMRWHHLIDYAVVIGETRFVDAPGEEGVQSAYTRKILDSTDRLRNAGSSPYLLHTGASSSVRTDLLRAAGGVNAALNMAEDTELGYRLAQAGAVFIPDADARAWHVGPSTVMLREKEVHRHNWSYLGDHLPDLRWLRSHPRRHWLVPYVRVAVSATTYEETRAGVDSALAGTLSDAAVTLVGPWGKLTGERRSNLDDPLLDLRLLHNLYAHEPRVEFAESAPGSAAPAPFLLTLPAGWVLGAGTLAGLVRHAERDLLGLVSVALAEGPDGVVAARLERTAAFARAALFPGAADDLVDEMFGSEWVSGTEHGIVPASEAEPLGGDPKWRALAGERLAEIRKLKAEVERLSAEVERLSEAPGEPVEREPRGPLNSIMRHFRSAG
ncbi:glycosyltransferase family 2 protein [Nonomuraea sp. FMUSA5-5]|uniref:4,4'-diaponeurosporenoate glycosyltransferase n=1 Tax=Nonomuraea composti TaxID=2720023 RepID=A0ABX1B5I0_9ACTN|nr:glycosyltransferase family 2 protein [Nonomuraea sp. FMUSA5-5]NJP92087.1 glycosyltransferase family 2 protein [Nonomuraea sp. FMUSA5-5]